MDDLLPGECAAHGCLPSRCDVRDMAPATLLSAYGRTVCSMRFVGGRASQLSRMQRCRVSADVLLVLLAHLVLPSQKFGCSVHDLRCRMACTRPLTSPWVSGSGPMLPRQKMSGGAQMPWACSSSVGRVCCQTGLFRLASPRSACQHHGCRSGRPTCRSIAQRRAWT